MQDQQCTRNKGTRSLTGKVFKGTLTEAPMKIKVSSIPSKHQNIIYHAPSRPAFGNSQTRFAICETETPGPGIYTPKQVEKDKFTISSKKGFGSFASQTPSKRFQLERNPYPAPNSYNGAKPAITIKKTKAKSLMQTDGFHPNSSLNKGHDIFRNQINQSMKRPGPGHYTSYNQIEARISRAISTGNLSFKSKINRFTIKNNDVPPVGLYNYDSNVVKPQTIKYTLPDRKQSTLKKQQYIEKLVGKGDSGEPNKLGPGSYQPYKPFAESQKSFKIRQGIYDRFGQLKEVYNLAKNQTATNNQYNAPRYSHENLRSNIDQFASKSNGFSSIFKSKSKRMKFQEPSIMDPCIYNATVQSNLKKSHLLNFSKKWV